MPILYHSTEGNFHKELPDATFPSFPLLGSNLLCTPFTSLFSCIIGIWNYGCCPCEMKVGVVPSLAYQEFASATPTPPAGDTNPSRFPAREFVAAGVTDISPSPCLQALYQEGQSMIQWTMTMNGVVPSKNWRSGGRRRRSGSRKEERVCTRSSSKTKVSEVCLRVLATWRPHYRSRCISL